MTFPRSEGSSPVKDRPLLRVVCAIHKTKTIGRVVAGPDGPQWLQWTSLSNGQRQWWLEEIGEPIPKHLAAYTSLAQVEADGGKYGGHVLGVCPRCKDVKWIDISTVKEALAKPSVHRVLTV